MHKRDTARMKQTAIKKEQRSLRQLENFANPRSQGYSKHPG